MLTLSPRGGAWWRPPSGIAYNYSFQHVPIVIDFSYNGCRQLLAKKKKWNFSGEPPVRAPLKFKKFKIFKSDLTWPPITPYFYCRIIKYYKNKDVCKKLELKILKFEKMADIFVMTKNFCDRQVRFLKNLFLGHFWKFFEFLFWFWPVGHKFKCMQ